MLDFFPVKITLFSYTKKERFCGRLTGHEFGQETNFFLRVASALNPGADLGLFSYGVAEHFEIVSFHGQNIRRHSPNKEGLKSNNYSFHCFIMAKSFQKSMIVSKYTKWVNICLKE